jgi:hypothetical protein
LLKKVWRKIKAYGQIIIEASYDGWDTLISIFKNPLMTKKGGGCAPYLLLYSLTPNLLKHHALFLVFGVATGCKYIWLQPLCQVKNEVFFFM